MLDRWPSAFTPAEAAEPLPPLEHARAIVDRFAVRHCGWPLDNVWLGALDDAGRLHAIPSGRALPEPLQLAVSAATLAGPPRVLEAPRVYLFALGRAQPLGDVPGFDDPVALQGTLFGPFALDPAAAQAPRRCRGSLCASRADVLDGLRQAARFAFHAPDARCHHLVLAAPEEDAPVLVYPLPPAAAAPVDNTGVTAALAYDALCALQRELRREDVEGAFPGTALPAPAGREAPRRGWLERLRRAFVRRDDELPPEGSLDDFLRLAALAVDELPGGVSARAREARRRVQVMEARWPDDDPYALERINNPDGGAVEGDVIRVPVEQVRKGGNLIFRVPPALYLHDVRAPVELEAELRDVGYGGQVCHVPAYQEGYKVAHTYALQDGGGWSRPTWRLPQTRLDGKLWMGDVALYFHGAAAAAPFELRRLVLRVLRPEWLDPARPCQGWLDVISGGTLVGGVWEVPASPGGVTFSGWVLDLGRRSPDGQALLVLRADGKEHVFGAAGREPRAHIVAAFGQAYERAGFSGHADLGALGPGLYRLALRLDPGGGAWVERELPGLRITAGSVLSTSR